jgi:heme o synthase
MSTISEKSDSHVMGRDAQATTEVGPAPSTTGSRRLLADIAELVKARLTFLVLITTLVGFLLGWHGETNLVYLLHTLVGTALAAAGAAALNQVFEVKFDARMHRTRNRPLVAQRITSDEGLMIGVLSSVAGILYLAIATNLTAALLSVITIAVYLFAYTPLKRVTTLNTIVGAIPGALPPVIGWAAARGEASFESWVLFAILFLWQMPHFLAIAWLYRDDYRNAGFVMLSGNDPECRVTGRQALLYAMLTVAVSLMPALLSITTMWYVPIALITGAYLIWTALCFALEGSTKAARQLFVASIIYLPVTFAALVLTRL